MLHKEIRKTNVDPPKRLRRGSAATPVYPNVSRLAVKKPLYSLRENSLLIPYDKAPLDAPGYKRVGLTLGNTFFSVDKRTFKPNGLITEMVDGLLVAWTSCGRCHSHWTNCKCPNGLMAARGIEYIYDKTLAESKGETWDYTHPHYQGSLMVKERQARLERAERQRFDAKPITHADPAPKPVKRLRRVADSVPEPVSPRRRLRKVETADKVLTGNRLNHKALDDAANHQAKKLSEALDKKLSAGPKRLRKRGDPK